MAQRMMINRMPSSMREKAWSSFEPKAMGVKMIRRMSIDLIKKLIIAQSSKLEAQSIKLNQKVIQLKS
jgi:hypothetical protein